MIGVSLLLSFMLIASAGILLQDAIEDNPAPARVPLEAHIMSKCPDARDCLHDLILPSMMNISDKVDFKLSYIGR